MNLALPWQHQGCTRAFRRLTPNAHRSRHGRFCFRPTAFRQQWQEFRLSLEAFRILEVSQNARGVGKPAVGHEDLGAQEIQIVAISGGTAPLMRSTA